MRGERESRRRRSEVILEVMTASGRRLYITDAMAKRIGASKSCRKMPERSGHALTLWRHRHMSRHTRTRLGGRRKARS